MQFCVWQHHAEVGEIAPRGLPREAASLWLEGKVRFHSTGRDDGQEHARDVERVLSTLSCLQTDQQHQDRCLPDLHLPLLPWAFLSGDNAGRGPDLWPEVQRYLWYGTETRIRAGLVVRVRWTERIRLRKTFVFLLKMARNSTRGKGREFYGKEPVVGQVETASLLVPQGTAFQRSYWRARMTDSFTEWPAKCRPWNTYVSPFSLLWRYFLWV